MAGRANEGQNREEERIRDKGVDFRSEQGQVPNDIDMRNIWNQATGGAITHPESVEDSRGNVLDPARDRRLTPHDRALGVMKQQGVSYEEAVQYVVDTMKDQGEIGEGGEARGKERGVAAGELRGEEAGGRGRRAA